MLGIYFFLIIFCLPINSMILPVIFSDTKGAARLRIDTARTVYLTMFLDVFVFG